MAAHLASAVAVDGGKVASFEGHEGRLAETWVKCREDMCGFAVYFFTPKVGPHARKSS